MPPVDIENPIINSPFAEPIKHFQFDSENNITANTVQGRRPTFPSQMIPEGSKPLAGGIAALNHLLASKRKPDPGRATP
jgi:hypothetical protein